ncbi:MAG TPA: ABC transporter ATP-binding protein [Conexibacter sp.]|nr:ABC transporter ATP-binding protein [Conexibacter sp.]
MLELHGVTVHYGAARAVAGADLAVAEGELVAIVGPNGAGKTSLLGAIAGSVPASGGTVRFRDRDVTGMHPDRIARCGISLVPEGGHVFTRLSVAENLRLAGAARRDRSDAARATSEAIERVPVLRDLLERRAGTLSGGEQQQLAIARALVTRPQLLLLDEPSLGLSPLAIELVFGIVAELKASGTTILLVEQATARALDVADRGLLMRDGRLEAVDAADAGALRAAYLGGGGA